MSWDEFSTLLSGLDENTPLGKVVAIRSEKDQKRIKYFTPEQKRIRREWAKRNAVKGGSDGYVAEMDALKKAFMGLANTNTKKN